MGKHHAILLFAALSNTLSGAAPATIPATRGTALDGHTVTLPHDLSAATILILGFSKNSEANSTAWEKAIIANLAAPPVITYFDIPILADAPSFVRPMILHSMRKQIPDALKPSFLPLTDNESAWKQAASYTASAPDAAYILLVDRTGVVRWQTHEAYNAVVVAQLSFAAKKLSSESR
jgi:hypothetical protein